MYAIEEGLQKINGEMVETFQREVVCGNTDLEVEAGTTGYKGGCCRDAGGRTYLSLLCLPDNFSFQVSTFNLIVSGVIQASLFNEDYSCRNSSRFSLDSLTSGGISHQISISHAKVQNIFLLPNYFGINSKKYCHYITFISSRRPTVNGWP